MNDFHLFLSFSVAIRYEGTVPPKIYYDQLLNLKPKSRKRVGLFTHGPCLNGFIKNICIFLTRHFRLGLNYYEHYER